LTRQALIADLMRITYFTSPILSQRVRPELAGRIRQAMADRSVGQVAKFSTLVGLSRARELVHAVRSRVASR
jgi:hypothetical protein